MSKRKGIPEEVQTVILTKSRRRCCLCYGLDHVNETVAGQLAHIDRDHENASEDNLVYLCLKHHDEYDSTTRQSKGLRVSEVRHWRDFLYGEMERIPVGPKSTAAGTRSQGHAVSVHNSSGNIFVGDGHSINISPLESERQSSKPIISLSLALAQHPVRGMVHCLAIKFLNRSERSVFIENFYLALNDSTRAIFARDGMTGEPQRKRKIEPGDKFVFYVSEDDLREIGRPATDYVCAGVGDAVNGAYETEKKTIQDHLADLLKER